MISSRKFTVGVENGKQISFFENNDPMASWAGWLNYGYEIETVRWKFPATVFENETVAAAVADRLSKPVAFWESDDAADDVIQQNFYSMFKCMIHNLHYR